MWLLAKKINSIKVLWQERVVEQNVYQRVYEQKLVSVSCEEVADED